MYKNGQKQNKLLRRGLIMTPALSLPYAHGSLPLAFPIASVPLYSIDLMVCRKNHFEFEKVS